ncbi:hypothetical protein [Amycolatopsis benzoatilytica]|uniref:hypothetical protein n=1 Tax=Amycolatopsis benzoatilytica TaxID=346045 RepID=UPI000371693F|nr:hypothetical protein [Amycolatopsis benzoatilytica]
MRTIVEVSGTVAAEPDEVFAELAGRLTRPAQYSMKLEIDRERRLCAAQGGWWYRGEYEVTDDPAGARVVHRVRNAATGQWWAVVLANRFFAGFRARTEAGFRELLAELAGPHRPGKSPAPR